MNWTLLAWAAGEIGSSAKQNQLYDNIDSIRTLLSQIFVNSIITGIVGPTSGSLTHTISAGQAWVGYRIDFPATAHTYGASQDTYVDLINTGVPAFPAVANGAAAPSVTANALRLFKVVTSGSAITSVTDLTYRGVLFSAAMGSNIIRTYASGSAVASIGTLTAGATGSLTITATGALVGDYVMVTTDTVLNAAFILHAQVTAGDTVTVYFYNSSAGSLATGTPTVYVNVIKRTTIVTP